LLNKEKFRKKLQGQNILAIKLPYKKVHEDVLWGQAKRLNRILLEAFNEKDFKVEKAKVWSDEKHSILFLYKLKKIIGKNTVWIKGPMLKDQKNLMAFMKSHKQVFSKKIEDGHVWLKIRNKYKNAVDVVKEKLKQTKEAGKYISERARGAKIYVRGKCLDLWRYKELRLELSKFFR
jgi:tRNA nucleotidyltransferase (CCA-adding enzyme)